MVELLNLHEVSVAYGQRPSQILKDGTIDEYSFDLFVLRKASEEKQKAK